MPALPDIAFQTMEPWIRRPEVRPEQQRSFGRIGGARRGGLRRIWQLRISNHFVRWDSRGARRPFNNPRRLSSGRIEAWMDRLAVYMMWHWEGQPFFQQLFKLRSVFQLRLHTSKGRTMTSNAFTCWLTAIQVIGVALITSGCGPQDQGTTTEPAVGPAGGRQQDEFEMVNITGDLYQAGVRGMGGHTTVFMVTPEGVILGDPIREDFAEWLKAELLERFDAQVEYVLYSHHHPDHASGGSVFADTATFVGHENMVASLGRLPSNSTPMDTNGNGTIERSEARGGFLAAFDRDDTNQDGILTAAEVNTHTHPPSVTYTDRLVVNLGGSTVEMHHTPPAHTDDMTILLFPEERVVFVVDFLQINRLPGGLSGFLAGYPVDSYEVAVGAVEALDFDTVIQGHSEITGTRSDVAEFMSLLRTTEAEVAAAIAAGMSLEETLDSVMLSDYTDWLLYETRRPQLVGDMYESLTEE